jgi:hypothetical protein
MLSLPRSSSIGYMSVSSIASRMICFVYRSDVVTTVGVASRL